MERERLVEDCAEIVEEVLKEKRLAEIEEKKSLLSFLMPRGLSKLDDSTKDTVSIGSTRDINN